MAVCLTTSAEMHAVAAPGFYCHVWQLMQLNRCWRKDGECPSSSVVLQCSRMWLAGWSHNKVFRGSIFANLDSLIACHPPSCWRILKTLKRIRVSQQARIGRGHSPLQIPCRFSALVLMYLILVVLIEHIGISSLDDMLAPHKTSVDDCWL